MAYEKVKITTIFITAIVLTAFVFGTRREVDDDTLKMLEMVMDYIRRNHPEAAPLIKDEMSWIESSKAIRIGYTSHIYTSDGWKVTVGHAVTAKIMYEVRAEHNEGIVWTGTIEDSVITEMSYTS